MSSFHKQKEIIGHAASVYSCVTQKPFIYSGSGDKHVARWKIEEGVQDNFTIKFNDAVYSLEIAWDSILIIGLSSGDLHFVDTVERREIKYYTQHRSAIFGLHYCPSSKYLFVGDADGNLSVWNDQFELVIYLPIGSGKIRSIRTNRTGEQLLIGCQDGTVRVFDLNNFNELVRIEAHKGGCSAVLFDPTDDNQIITGGKDARIKRWNMQNEALLQNIPAHNFSVYDMILLNDQKQMASASRDGTIKIWNVTDLDFIQRLDRKAGGHTHSVNALSKIDENSFVSCSDDKRLIIWALEN